MEGGGRRGRGTMGRWTMDRGRWEDGPWTVDGGRWEDGPWTMDDGKMDHGPRTMDGGRGPWSIVYRLSSMVNRQLRIRAGLRELRKNRGRGNYERPGSCGLRSGFDDSLDPGGWHREGSGGGG